MSLKRKPNNSIDTPVKSASEKDKGEWRGIIFWFLVTMIPLSLFTGLSALITSNLPTSDRLENTSPNLPSKVYSRDDVLIKEFFTERRIYMTLDQVPDLIVKSILATEDHRFYSHWGVVPSRFLKVTLVYLTTGSKAQGASTITQQLARTLFLTREKTIIRKIKEIFTAIQLERKYTKYEILEMYVNHMPFGYGTYGIEAAAQRFFNKTSQDLTPAEVAVLTGVLQRPANLNLEKYNLNPVIQKYVLDRRNLVLSQMLLRNVITQEQYQEAVNSEIVFAPGDESVFVNIAPYFTEDIRRVLYSEYGMNIYTSGMEIYTTLDSRVQACAERYINKHLPNLQASVNRNMRKKKNFVRIVPPSYLKKRSLDALMADKALVDSLISAKCAVQVAFIAIEPQTGNVLAMVGGRNFQESEFNRVSQAIRQPGSIFKPFVYTAAIDNGYMPFYEKLNQPIVVHMYDGTRWTPHNYDGSIGGKTTLRDALRASLNLVTARLVQEDVPPEQVIRYARNLGITTHLEAVDAIALGAIGVKPIEIVSAFGVFANKGVLAAPHYLDRVQDKYGNILETASPEVKGVLREETAYIMASMLQTVAAHGTGSTSRSLYDFMRPAGGKTGTTNDFTDAWYVTFTPQIVAGVWVGLDDPSLSLGERQSGAIAAIPIVAPFMKAAHDTLGLPVVEFERPEGVVEVEICKETKQLATDFCPEVLKEICDVRFLPQDRCDIHTGQKDGRSTTGTQKRLTY